MESFEGQTILVVEDNFMSYKLIEAHFSRVDLKMLHADNGEKALELFSESSEIDLILMDIQLPKLNGLQVTRAIREKDTLVPIIAATANVFDEDKQACIEAGCNAFVAKPINFPELFYLINKILKG